MQAIQPVSPDRAGPQPSGGAPLRPRDNARAAEAPHDEVQVSDEARRLSATDSGRGLQLDPRTLRELVGIRAPSDQLRARDDA